MDRTRIAIGVLGVVGAGTIWMLVRQQTSVNPASLGPEGNRPVASTPSDPTERSRTSVEFPDPGHLGPARGTTPATDSPEDSPTARVQRGFEEFMTLDEEGRAAYLRENRALWFESDWLLMQKRIELMRTADDPEERFTAARSVNQTCIAIILAKQGRERLSCEDDLATPRSGTDGTWTLVQNNWQYVVHAEEFPEYAFLAEALIAHHMEDSRSGPDAQITDVAVYPEIPPHIMSLIEYRLAVAQEYLDR